MANHRVAQIESRDSSCRRVELENAAKIERKLGSVLGPGQQHKDAHIAGAVDAAVAQVGESRPHFPKHSEPVASPSELCTKDRVGSRAPVHEAERGPHLGRREDRVVIGKKVGFGFERGPSGQVERYAAAKPGGRGVEVAEMKKASLRAHFKA